MKPFWTTLCFITIIAACATPAPYQRGDIYIAHYRPMSAPEGGVVVSSTASANGVLAVRSGCLVMLAGAEVMLPAFREQVRLVVENENVGIEDTLTGQTAFVGEAISLGGASAPENSDFAKTRLVEPLPPECAHRIFVSNSGFESD